MYEFKTNKILKKDFVTLNEDDVMFITNPGRMGDEDGITFIIKKDRDLIVYRIDGLMYQKEKEIYLKDVEEQFPKWFETWKNWNNENYQGKYQYIYMGFGNGLSIDNSIYDEFKPFLDKRIESYLEKYSKEEKEKYQFAAVMNVWSKALTDMANEKKYVLK